MTRKSIFETEHEMIDNFIEKHKDDTETLSVIKVLLKRIEYTQKKKLNTDPLLAKLAELK